MTSSSESNIGPYFDEELELAVERMPMLVTPTSSTSGHETFVFISGDIAQLVMLISPPEPLVSPALMHLTNSSDLCH